MKLFDNTTFKDSPFLTTVTVKDNKIIRQVSKEEKGLALNLFPNNSSYCKKIEKLYKYKEKRLVGMWFTKDNIKEDELPLRYGYPDFERLWWQGTETYGEPCRLGFPFVFRAILSNTLDKLKVKKEGDKANYGLLGYSYVLIKEQKGEKENHSWIITLKLIKRDRKTDNPIGRPFYNIGVITDIFTQSATIQAEFNTPRIHFIKPREREDLDYNLPAGKRKKYKRV